ncbi:hypothetical protein ACFSVM_15925 [Paenibacillus shunpengii]|uniref:Uncharacterized protein n=1 Tax=Paenibacillus shunpengii TaxID=2054424 RepID=A0ABW5SRK4_9BACL
MKCDGRNSTRKIRHLSIFGKKSYLHIPAFRSGCSAFSAISNPS